MEAWCNRPSLLRLPIFQFANKFQSMFDTHVAFIACKSTITSTKAKHLGTLLFSLSTCDVHSKLPCKNKLCSFFHSFRIFLLIPTLTYTIRKVFRLKLTWLDSDKMTCIPYTCNLHDIYVYAKLYEVYHG